MKRGEIITQQNFEKMLQNLLKRVNSITRVYATTGQFVVRASNFDSMLLSCDIEQGFMGERIYDSTSSFQGTTTSNYSADFMQEFDDLAGRVL